MREQKLTRRTFLGLGATAAVAGAAGLAGCAPAAKSDAGADAGAAEGGAFGAALVAGAGCGLWDSLPQALEILRVQDVTDPSADAERYEAPYQTYTKLYQALQTIQAK